ncbi:phenylacetic acid degradation protein [Deinococcus pimensis]|uniref:phenylacetic acid degradation protein n=1 Tax=Deinococcus pimensis TaxID=309888 RepID=UPI0005EAF3FD|nr:phenylacetic acid degradation protein [Deinococcus pimensis]
MTGRPDTQWPRWEVFKQDAPGRPHQAVGSVHATDADHALVTARTLFARRPSAVSMWAVPDHAILARTQEQDERGEPLPDLASGDVRTYVVARKTTHKRSMTFVDVVGTVDADSPAAALALARERFPEPPALAWWVFPDAAVARTDDTPGTVESWFAPAKDKTYRQQSSYGVVGTHASKRNPRAGGPDRD